MTSKIWLWALLTAAVAMAIGLYLGGTLKGFIAENLELFVYGFVLLLIVMVVWLVGRNIYFGVTGKKPDITLQGTPKKLWYVLLIVGILYSGFQIWESVQFRHELSQIPLPTETEAFKELNQ